MKRLSAVSLVLSIGLAFTLFTPAYACTADDFHAIEQVISALFTPCADAMSTVTDDASMASDAFNAGSSDIGTLVPDARAMYRTCGQSIRTINTTYASASLKRDGDWRSYRSVMGSLLRAMQLW